MTNYVLVGGAWLGGWCWKPAARRLRDNGHDAYPVTLTGLGERAHLSRPEIDLNTHIADVVNLIEFEDLREVVLLGHSYAGIVVTGVADRIRDRISQLAYLDSGPTPDGLSFLDMQPPEVKQHIERQVAELGDGWRLPVPSWEELENVIGASLEGLDEPQRRLMRAHAVAPYRVEEEDREARVYVYDPNHPGDRRRFVEFWQGGAGKSVEFAYGGFRSREGWGITLVPLSALGESRRLLVN